MKKKILKFFGTICTLAIAEVGAETSDKAGDYRNLWASAELGYDIVSQITMQLMENYDFCKNEQPIQTLDDLIINHPERASVGYMYGRTLASDIFGEEAIGFSPMHMRKDENILNPFFISPYHLDSLQMIEPRKSAIFSEIFRNPEPLEAEIDSFLSWIKVRQNVANAMIKQIDRVRCLINDEALSSLFGFEVATESHSNNPISIVHTDRMQKLQTIFMKSHLGDERLHTVFQEQTPALSKDNMRKLDVLKEYVEDSSNNNLKLLSGIKLSVAKVLEIFSPTVSWASKKIVKHVKKRIDQIHDFVWDMPASFNTSDFRVLIDWRRDIPLRFFGAPGSNEEYPVNVAVSVISGSQMEEDLLAPTAVDLMALRPEDFKKISKNMHELERFNDASFHIGRLASNQMAHVIIGQNGHTSSEDCFSTVKWQLFSPLYGEVSKLYSLKADGLEVILQDANLKSEIATEIVRRERIAMYQAVAIVDNFEAHVADHQGNNRINFERLLWESEVKPIISSLALEYDHNH